MSTATLQDVLTLEDAATYLRLSKEMVRKKAEAGDIPGRQVEGSWRFLRIALETWLGTSDSRSILLKQAGAFADDDSIEELLGQIYKARGRPEITPED